MTRHAGSEPTKRHMPTVKVKSWSFGFSRKERRHPREGLRKLNGMPILEDMKKGNVKREKQENQR